MDKTTLVFLNNLNVYTYEGVLEKLNTINNKYKHREIDMNLFRELYDMVDKEFYSGELSKLLNGNIRFYLISSDNLMECTKYESEDRESRVYTLGLGFNKYVVASCDGELYSGGYITCSKIEFIVLMLLHETIHLVEFNDSYLETLDADHTILFYQIGYKFFKMLSQYSTIIQEGDQLKKITQPHIRRLKKKTPLF